jgi:ribonucleoside-diphosphate reductase alpha chain
MGFAECLILLGVSYDSAEAIEWAHRFMAVIAKEAAAASTRLAEERGVFPNWSRSVYAARGRRVRNATRLSIAPTGTISIIAGTSGGIEPLFALDGSRILEQILGAGHLRDVPGVPAAVRWLFVTATEITPLQHLRIQQAFQHHVDNAVSKTINLPEESSHEDVAQAYLEAWRLGLKGITIYRSGSQSRQVLTLGAGEDATSREFFVKCDPGACRL